MPLRCTCGAYPPEDARFCHKCARPLYEDVVEAPIEEVRPHQAGPPPLPVPAAQGIGFGNSRAVSISIIVAGGALIGLIALGPFAPFLDPVLLCGAGFLAVHLYHRRSTAPPTPTEGARLGWMTGLWLFLFIAIVFAMLSVVITTPSFRESAKQLSTSFPDAAKMLADPHEFLVQMLLKLVVSFFLFTLLPGVGGILGAKLLTRRRHSS